MLESLGLAVLRKLDPETAHGLALQALIRGLAPRPGPVTSARLACDLAGMRLLNPVGLAAGFDKNATAVAALSRAGFGFLEVGAATPLAQTGNPRPRLFRLAQDRAARHALLGNGKSAKLAWAMQDYHPAGAVGNAAAATAENGRAVVQAAAVQLALLLQDLHALPLSTLVHTPDLSAL